MHIPTKKVSRVPEDIKKGLDIAKQVAPIVAEVAIDLAPTKKAKKDVKSIAAIVLSILAIAGQIFQSMN